MSPAPERLTDAEIDEKIAYYIRLDEFGDEHADALREAYQHVKSERQDAAKWRRRCLMPLLELFASETINTMAWLCTFDRVDYPYVHVELESPRSLYLSVPKRISREQFTDMLRRGWFEQSGAIPTHYHFTTAGRAAYAAMCKESDNV